MVALVSRLFQDSVAAMTPKRWQVEAEKLVDDVLFAWVPLIEKPEHKRLRDRLILEIASALSRLEAETVARCQQEQDMILGVVPSKVRACSCGLDAALSQDAAE